jgi:hypothetical protein
MSKQSLQAKIEFIVEMVDNIDAIAKRHGGIVKALEDFEGQMALLMGLSQIGETLKKHLLFRKSTRSRINFFVQAKACVTDT